MIPVRLAMLAALASALWGQAKPKDIDGWDKIKWGMTIANARAAYSVETPPERNGDWTLLNLKPVKMDGIEMGVQVGAGNRGNKVTSVRLFSYFGLANSPPKAGPQDFDTLRNSLLEKYGRSTNEELKHGENFRLIKTVLWTFPSTSILLSLEQSTSLPNLGNVELEYTAHR